MKLLLLCVYYFFGFVFAFFVAISIAMLIGSLISLMAGKFNRACKLALGLVMWAGLSWGIFFVSGWIGDRTQYVGQSALLWGMLFPGGLFLFAIPALTKNAVKAVEGDSSL
jgi:hypothetical protein